MLFLKKILPQLLSLALLLAINHTAPASVNSPGAPVALVFDTDLGNDVDDALALGLIHALESRGYCELLAVTVTKDHSLAGPFADAINTFYGRPDIPVAVVRDGPTKRQGLYNGLVEERNEDGSYRYPHDLVTGDDAPEAAQFLRKLLSDREDQSVVLLQVGFFTNYRRLLESDPDEISPLSGRELIERKVRLLSVMAGSFQTIDDSNGYVEYNVKNDIPSAQILAESWPTPIIWSGFEIGIAATYPHESIEQDYEYVEHHPLKEAYYLYKAPPHNRPTWDLTSVLVAVLPDRGYFGLSKPGKVTVGDNGFTHFAPGKSDRDRFLKLTPEQIVRIREAFVQLCSEPPKAD